MTNLFLRNISGATILNRLLAIGVMVVAATVSSKLSADDLFILSHLENNKETSYLQTGGRQLVPFVTDSMRPDNLVEYQKLIKGMPLHGGIVRVFMADDGTVANVFDHSSESMEIDNTAPALTGDAAERLVGLSLKNSNVTATDFSSKLVLFRNGDSASYAWEVNTTLVDTGQPGSPTGAITVVDAQSGEFLSQSQSDTRDYMAPGAVFSAYPRMVINDAIGPNGSRNYAAQFEEIPLVDFCCTGILVADNLVLSARHCGLVSGGDVRFGEDSNNPTFVTSIQSVSLPDGFGSFLDGGDVAILRLASSVPASVATPMRLTTQQDELVGQVAAMAGYGYNGVGSQGHGFSADERRWGGENIIDSYGAPEGNSGSNVISTDFDDGSNGANQIPGSSATPIQFEATTAPGDSGGPVMININGEWVVAGVLSGGTTQFSTYGDVSWWTGTAEFESEIAAEGGVFIREQSFHLDNITVFRGNATGGAMADILESDDSYMTFNPGFILNSNEAPVWLIFDALLPSSSPDALTLTLESQANTPGLTATVEALNWSTGLFDSLDTSAPGFNSDQVVTLDLTSASSDYVQASSGAVLSRVGWRQTGFTLLFPWEVRLDQAIWTVN